MPAKQHMETVRRAKKKLRQGRKLAVKGEFVREGARRMDERGRKRRSRSSRRAIALGLSRARRAGVAVPKKRIRDAASLGVEKPVRKLGPQRRRRPLLSKRRRRAISAAFRRERRRQRAGSRAALARGAKRIRGARVRRGLR